MHQVDQLDLQLLELSQRLLLQAYHVLLSTTYESATGMNQRPV